MLEMLTRLEAGTLGAALQLIMLEEGTCLIESPAAIALDAEVARTDVVKEVEDVCDNTIVGEGMLKEVEDVCDNTIVGEGMLKEVEDVCDNTIVGEGMLRGDASCGSLGGWSGKFSLALGPLKFLAAAS
jgi:hypothetical protein